MLTYFSFETHPSKPLLTDFKGRLVVSGEAVFATEKTSKVIARPAYAIATTEGWRLMASSDYGPDPQSLINEELNSVVPQLLQSFQQ